MKTIGLALGGGGARGCAHVGVIKSLLSAGLRIQFVAGTSIGSVVGGIFASGDLESFEKYLLDVKWTDVVKHFDPGVPYRGLFKGNKVVKLLNRLITHKQFKDLAIPFTAVATNLETGEEVRLNQGKVIDAIRASIAIPGIFTPFKKGHRFLIDGGVVNPVPVDVVRQMGADVVVAVDLNHEFIKEKLRSRKRKHLEKNNIVEWLTPDRPNIIDIIENSIFMMQNEITEKKMKSNKPDILVRPELNSARIFDFHKAGNLIGEGFACMNQFLPELKQLLGSNPA
jgi:NTE family protein